MIRGHKTYCDDNGVWRYCDTNEPTVETWKQRPCGICGDHFTKEGHDPCLGTLDETKVMNACCGHGDGGDAYIQYWDKSDVQGQEAIDEQQRLIKLRDNLK